MKLNLETKNKEQEVLKEYLENNVSEILADKINNGVKITKDGKTLLSKKDLDGFIKYATEEARKQAEKSATSACIHSDIVFGWAIHYFEEDSIEGKLYNEDGSEYKEVQNKTTTQTYTPKLTPKPEKPKQPSLFDFLTPSNPPKQENDNLSYKAQCSTFSQPDPIDSDDESDEENDFDEQDEELFGTPKVVEKPKIPTYYTEYVEYENSYPNAIILTKIGDFYEVFNENAQKTAQILDLVLTSKDVGLDNKITMAGFPYHIKDKYFDKLTNQYNLVVLENGKPEFIKQKESPIIQNVDTFDKDLCKMISILLDNKVVIK